MAARKAKSSAGKPSVPASFYPRDSRGRFVALADYQPRDAAGHFLPAKKIPKAVRVLVERARQQRRDAAAAQKAAKKKVARKRLSDEALAQKSFDATMQRVRLSLGALRLVEAATAATEAASRVAIDSKDAVESATASAVSSAQAARAAKFASRARGHAVEAQKNADACPPSSPLFDKAQKASLRAARYASLAERLSATASSAASSAAIAADRKKVEQERKKKRLEQRKRRRKEQDEEIRRLREEQKRIEEEEKKRAEEDKKRAEEERRRKVAEAEAAADEESRKKQLEDLYTPEVEEPEEPPMEGVVVTPEEILELELRRLRREAIKSGVHREIDSDPVLTRNPNTGTLGQTIRVGQMVNEDGLAENLAKIAGDVAEQILALDGGKPVWASFYLMEWAPAGGFVGSIDKVIASGASGTLVTSWQATKGKDDAGKLEKAVKHLFKSRLLGGRTAAFVEAMVIRNHRSK